jgi:hypothetical protein
MPWGTIKYWIDYRKEYFVVGKWWSSLYNRPCSISCPGLCTPGKGIRYPLHSRLGGSQGRPGGCEISRLHGDSIHWPSSSYRLAIPTTFFRSKYAVLTKVMKGKYFRFQTILLPSIFCSATLLCHPTLYACLTEHNISPHFKYMVARKSLYHTGNMLNMQFSRCFKYRAEKMSLDPEGNTFNIECQATVD